MTALKLLELLELLNNAGHRSTDVDTAFTKIVAEVLDKYGRLLLAATRHTKHTTELLVRWQGRYVCVALPCGPVACPGLACSAPQ